MQLLNASFLNDVTLPTLCFEENKDSLACSQSYKVVSQHDSGIDKKEESLN